MGDTRQVLRVLRDAGTEVDGFLAQARTQGRAQRTGHFISAANTVAGLPNRLAPYLPDLDASMRVPVAERVQSLLARAIDLLASGDATSLSETLGGRDGNKSPLFKLIEDIESGAISAF